MPSSPKALSRTKIKSKLNSLPAWKLGKDAIERKVSFQTYLDALRFVDKLGRAAERADHHPYLVIDYKRVTIKYSTHSANGITNLDLKMAGVAEKLIWKAEKN